MNLFSIKEKQVSFAFFPLFYFFYSRWRVAKRVSCVIISTRHIPNLFIISFGERTKINKCREREKDSSLFLLLFSHKRKYPTFDTAMVYLFPQGFLPLLSMKYYFSLGRCSRSFFFENSSLTRKRMNYSSFSNILFFFPIRKFPFCYLMVRGSFLN